MPALFLNIVASFASFVHKPAYRLAYRSLAGQHAGLQLPDSRSVEVAVATSAHSSMAYYHSFDVLPYIQHIP